ncbi:GGDEF domain-containing protein [Pseudosulfitobacter koreensis]|uniref:GGDEF domain-containing protein n=1 Tax=Pseudosulfitobacter koreensis TaxID=2968472 RepID=A0ABT1Z4T1_9RHOB|nr:GGDEF domain-containing protein [Pseudosulfitobacter koreense]MCR8828151.1 GGDEF domain-containing protein [Pseudosulfitobacter koreense]
MTDTQNMPAVLDMLCPMYVMINRTGHITHVGPTLRKLRPEMAWGGARFLEVFALKRPRAVTSVTDLRDHAGIKLHLQLRDAPATELKGVAVKCGAEDALIVNLSFGISVVDGVQTYDLTHADFAPTDLATEMLYLVEAKSTAMEAWRKLNLRLQGAKIAAEEQAFTDTLTGLKNRRAVDHVMARALQRDSQFALMQLDLDFFKRVNDTLGHAAGDHVLQTVARIMVDETRSEDTVARLGGDEFVIVLPGVRDAAALRRIGSRMIKRLEMPIPFEGRECCISASIGTVFFEPGSGANMRTLLDDVDVALYASKRTGRGRQTFYNEDLRQTTDAPAHAHTGDTNRKAVIMRPVPE